MSAVITGRAITQNFASAKAGWIARSLILIVRVTFSRPGLILCTELYATKRGRITKRLAKRGYLCAGYNRGKVLYIRKDRWRAISKPYKIALGNGKHAVAVRLQHRAAGGWLTVVVAHLSWQKTADTKRERQTNRLVELVEAKFGKGPTIYGGDWNSSIHKGSRKRDAVGEVMRKLGLTEAYRLATKHTHSLFNSSNQFRRPAPAKRIHLDRFFGRLVTWRSWRLDYYKGRLGSDHWGIEVKYTIPVVKRRL